MPKGKTVNFVTASDFNVANVRISSDFKKPSETAMAPGCSIEYHYDNGTWGPLNIRGKNLTVDNVNNNIDWLKKNGKPDDSPKYTLAINLGRENEQVNGETLHFREQLFKLNDLICEFIAEHCENLKFDGKVMLYKNDIVEKAIKKANKQKLTGKARTKAICDVISCNGLVESYQYESNHAKYADQTKYTLKLKVPYEPCSDGTNTPNLMILSHKKKSQELNREGVTMDDFTKMFYWGAPLAIMFNISRFMVIGGDKVYMQMYPKQVVQPPPRDNLASAPVFSDESGDESESDNDAPAPTDTKKPAKVVTTTVDDSESEDETNENELGSDESEDDEPVTPPKSSKSSKSKPTPESESESEDDEPVTPPPKSSKSSKSSKAKPAPEPESESDNDDADNAESESEDDEPVTPPPKSTKTRGKKAKPEPTPEPESDDESETVVKKKSTRKPRK